MSIHAALHHVTKYDYDRVVTLGPQVIRLRPAPHARTDVLSYALEITPEPHFINWQQDPYGNFLARVVFPEPVRHFHIKVDLVADMAVQNPFDFFLEPDATEFPFTYDEHLKDDLEAYLAPLPAGPKLQAWLDSVPREAMGTVDFLVALNARLQQEIAYLIRMEPGVQTPEETLTLGKGSCRDSGWLLVQILRHLGLAARFVSGYLIQLTPDVKSLDGPSGPETDFTDLHAWTEVYLPGAGWVGLDPTSGLLAGEGHIPLAATPEPRSAAPITGAVERSEVAFDVEMAITRLRETPRVTKPYSDEQWAAIDELGAAIDADLVAEDVRLTMGGEPTFVAIDHPNGEEWNTAAVGPTKRPLAEELIRRFQERFAPGGFLHFGQGKWYPGEQLPRWTFSLYWRRDGKPIWRNPDLVAGEKSEEQASIDEAETLTKTIASSLGLETKAVHSAFEDPMHFITREHQLPENLDPLDSKLDDPMERARLARVFKHGLGNPTGYVLPVQRWQAKAGRGWLSEAWSTRAGRLLLTPGDSPVGLRLPLDSLPYIASSDYPYIIPTDPFEERGDLPDPDAMHQAYRREDNSAHAPRQALTPQSVGGRGHGFVRTALVVEPRGGKLCVFMPPTETLEDYLELLATVEDSAEELGLKVHIEGYSPPNDPRLNVIKVAPDPGVIEVNIQPAHSWEEMKAITEGIYEDAHFTRLGTEKFMLDGRHTGTGGGNHVVVGGATPADSPFLRRPDLLKSLILYWQHHPSLSYLFSGLFIGPTSQAPRIDEARHDALHELELAIAQVPSPGGDETQSEGRGAPPPPPWLVDRLFRHLLVDVSGNTHRAEICIDKLYSPDGPTGRLGLIEFRAFEMPPHARMSLTQQLLLRALILRFWKEPYEGSFVRFGTSLHDRYMLPHYVWQDLEDVIGDMQAHGYDLDAAWFLPHFEFRFPVYGKVEFGDVEIEIRQALEPWHVLGEEGAVGGTVRFVDSSVERVQVKVSGLTDQRYIVACNGERVPLRSTGREGEAVAGVRFRAWQPPSCLHPTIGVNTPLVFDLYDRWNKRAVAGCTYHAAHPGGRNFEHFPVNAYEAESRRLARFFGIGHTPGRYNEPRNQSRDEFPLTLDLRWSSDSVRAADR
ncbi:MAG: transglutaminase family protein [Alphaproteobacteria bacterium]